MMLQRDELHALIDEIQATRGAQIQKIQQPSHDELQLHLRLPGQSLWLYISLEKGLERLHLIPQKETALPEPPNFCMRLRKELLHTRLQEIALIDDERIALLTFRNAETSFHLLAEMLPRKGQLFLLDAEYNLLASLYPLSLQRGLRFHDPYLPPSLREDWQLSSPLLLHNNEQTRLIALREEGEALLQADPALAQEMPLLANLPLQIAVAKRYATQSHKHRFQRLQQEALKSRRKLHKKLERLILNLREDLERCEEGLQREQDAELLKPIIHKLARGMTEIEVTDYYDPQLRPRKIALQPELSPLENLEKLFQRVKRARKGIQAITPRLAQTQQQCEQIAFEIELITSLEHLDDLLPYVHATESQQPLPLAKAAPTRSNSLPYNVFFSKQGERILVGRNSRANDELTFRCSRGNDLWLHARGWPGSHVVIPRQRQQIISDQTLLDAATLAIHFSKARDLPLVDVISTQVKYIRKPRNAGPGQVSVMRDQNIALRLEPERLQRLLTHKDTPASPTPPNPAHETTQEN